MKKTINKTVRSRSIILGMALATGLAFPLMTHAEEKDAPTVIPETSAAIHQAVDKETDEMEKMIQEGKIGDLHHHAFAVRDLVAALPDKSSSLPVEKLATVKADAKFVATLADRLDAAGDSNDKAASESNFGKLKDVLKSIWANYPDSSQPVQSPEKPVADKP